MIRPFRKETAPGHLVDIPKDATRYDPQRDCSKPRDRDCVVAAVERFGKILGDTTKTKKERATAVMFLVHFVGDLHQPLHCADDKDRGGNEVEVGLYSRKSNLHAVWDNGLLVNSKLSEDELAALLKQQADGADTKAIEAGTPAAWAVDAHTKAKRNAYAIGIEEHPRLGDKYKKRNLPVVEEQLMKAACASR